VLDLESRRPARDLYSAPTILDFPPGSGFTYTGA
jgi:hypothetical protein